MPTLLREATVNLEFSDLLLRMPIERKPRPARTPGIHVSGVLKAVAVRLGVLKAGEKLEEEYPWRMALGEAWEEYIFSLMPESRWQPGERGRKYGIYGTADGITNKLPITLQMVCDNGVWVPSKRSHKHFLTCLDETKCTEKAVRSGEDFCSFDDNWLWLHQCAAYCTLYDMDIVRWRVMFYRGDRRGSGPTCVEYLVHFSPAEIRGTWRMIEANKHLAEKEG